MNSSKNDLFDKVQTIKLILVRRATGKTKEGDDDGYMDLRQEVIQNTIIKDYLPNFIRVCQDLRDFWDFIKPKFSTYDARRYYIENEFDEILNFLGRSENDPASQDSFELQFPFGLPFGLKKPEVKMESESGTMKTSFEETVGIGIIKKGVYPNLSFHNLQGMTSILNSNSNKADILQSMCQTDYEKQFLKAYIEKYNMLEENIPALIPQAWIQWHSLTKKDLRSQNSDYADKLYRVDFVAFWGNKRYTILIDDISHYAIKNYKYWNASEEAYSKRLKEDRKLRKEKWQVFRLSNWEMRDSQCIDEILKDLKEFIEF